jgi:YVTN family beta-propeller protein
MLEFRVLGPLEVVEHGQPLALGGPKQRALLAILVLRRGDVVSADRLIDLLWGERPPATAAKTLQGYVSHLRKALGDGVLLTRSGGYLLAAKPEQVDAEQFEASVVEARDALAVGDAVRSRELLVSALALWRGEPLADLAFERFAGGEVARLEEARLAALEDRIEADLVLGRHRAVVGELEALVGLHPNSERLLGQLMLALYRSGRQVEALDAYRRGHRALRDELGLEPGPELRALEQRILTQDAALAPPSPRSLRAAGPPRRGMVLALVTTAILAASIAGAVAIVHDSRSADAVSVPANSVAVIDPRAGSVVEAIRVGENPGPVSAGAGNLWALDLDSATLARIDVRTRRLLETKGIGGAPTNRGTPGNVVASQDEVWVSAAGCNGPDPGELLHVFSAGDEGIDLGGADDVDLDGAVPEPRRHEVEGSSLLGCGLAARGTSAWVATTGPPGIARVDYNPVAGRSQVVWGRPLAGLTDAIALGHGSVWAVDSQHEVIRRIDEKTGRTDRRLRAGADPVAIAINARAVWVANAGDNSVSRIDPRTDRVTQAIAVGKGPVAVATGDGAVWVAMSDSGSVARIDPRTNRVTATIAVGHRLQGITVAGGLVWVTVRT